jgi:hypothetical protein
MTAPQPVPRSQVHPQVIARARKLQDSRPPAIEPAAWADRPIVFSSEREVLILNYPGQTWPAKRPRRTRKATS